MAKKADEAKNAKLMDDRAKALETTLASLEKQFGKGTVMKLGEQAHMKVDVVPTGCLELDLALGVGGWVYGRRLLARRRAAREALEAGEGDDTGKQGEA